MFVDEDGEWPGITFFYYEFEVGAGLGYGLNYVHQRGVAYDEVGKTRFVASSALYIANQTDSKMSTSPEIVAGASISGTGNIKQNWSSETFLGLIAGTGVGLPVPVSDVVPIKGKYGAAIAGSISLSSDEFQVGLGVGVGLKVSVISTTIDESISLTDKEYTLAEAYGPGQVSWNIINQQAVKNDKGEITGYSGEVKAGKYATGIKVFSDAIKDKNGDAKTSNIWASKDYKEAAQKAEAESK